MKPSQLILTGDGYLTGDRDGRRTKSILPAGDNRTPVAPGSPHGPIYGTAISTVYFPPKVIGEEGLELLHKDANPQKRIERHIRSFLARMSLDGYIRNVDVHRSKGLAIEMEFINYVNAQRDGRLMFPLFQAMRKYIREQNLRVMNLFLFPEGVTHLLPEELEEEIAEGGIDMAKNWKMRDEGTVVSPVDPHLRYESGAAVTITSGDWPEVFRNAKRGLKPHQPRLAPLKTLTPGFNVLATRMNIRDGLVFLLDGKVTHEDLRHKANVEKYVHQSGSPGLEAHGGGPRHLELSTALAGVPVEGLGVKGKFYRVKHAIGPDPIAVTVPRNVTTLDETVKTAEREIQELLTMIEELPDVAGVLVQSEGDPIVFPTGASALGTMARYAVREGMLPDERYNDRVPPEVRNALHRHPAISALQAAAKNPGNHYLRRILLSHASLTPGDMHNLSNDAGVGAFFAKTLQLPNGEKDSLEQYAVSVEQIERLAKYVRNEDFRFYWQAPTGPLRELVGLSFVDHNRVEDFKKLDHVTSIFCTHREGMDAWLRPQLDDWLRPLLEKGMNVGIATGASTGNMKALAEILVRDYPEVFLIGSANILPGQKPSFIEPAFTLFSGRYRRHRQTLLGTIADQFVSLKGGRGSIGEICETMVDESTKFVPPTIMGLIDQDATDKRHYFDPLVEQYRRAAVEPSPDHAYMAKWIAEHLLPFKSLGTYGAAVREFMDDPVGWWKLKGVPEDIIEGSLRTHIQNAAYTGRRPAKYYEKAFEVYGIDPLAV